MSIKKYGLAIIMFISLTGISVHAQSKQSKRFHVIAFFTARNDQAHISFVHQANQWFPSIAAAHNFTYDTTSNWSNLNKEFLSNYQVVLFLDTRPETTAQREAFQYYMEHGGAWMGFHFAAFALTPSDYAQNWDWYHEKFIGAGQFKSNTWRPTSAVLKVEAPAHPVLIGLPTTFKTTPNEWYRWENDLTKNPDIKILLSIDPSSFPLGTGPKLDEIWHEGYYPVVWTNTNYKMLYVNMGHNDIDYEHGTNKDLSNTFESADENNFLVNALMWLGSRK